MFQKWWSVLPTTSVTLLNHSPMALFSLEKAHRNVCFTLNNPVEEPEAFALALQSALPVGYLVFQEEQVTTRHFQGYFELNKQVRGRKIKDALPTAHLEDRKGTQDEAITYCKKPESRLRGPWEFGTPKQQGRRTDIAEAVATLRSAGMAAVVEQHPTTFVKYASGLARLSVQLTKYTRREQPSVTLLYGPSGVGKSHWAWSREPQLVSVSGNLKWFDNYQGEEAVLFDEFDGKLSGTPLKHFLNLTDRYPLMVEVKGAHVSAMWTRVYITTNIHPRFWYDWVGREAQYPAVVRRITNVVWWKSDTRADNVELTPEHPSWEHFFAGPPAAAPVVLGPLDDYIVHEERNLFNF